MIDRALDIQFLIRRFAGTFILVSLALGWWVHPAWFLLTASVGLNLLQSSFTRFCPLERVLGAMYYPRESREGRAER